MRISREAAKPRRETINTHPDFAFFAPSRASGDMDYLEIIRPLGGDFNKAKKSKNFRAGPCPGPEYRQVYSPAGTTLMPVVRTFWPPSTTNARSEPEVISPVYSTFWLFFAQTSVSTRSPEAMISTEESLN